MRRGKLASREIDLINRWNIAAGWGGGEGGEGGGMQETRENETGAKHGCTLTQSNTGNKRETLRGRQCANRNKSIHFQFPSMKIVASVAGK